MTIGADGTIWCPLERKKSLNDSRISFAVSIYLNLFYLSVSLSANLLKKSCLENFDARDIALGLAFEVYEYAVHVGGCRVEVVIQARVVEKKPQG